MNSDSDVSDESFDYEQEATSSRDSCGFRDRFGMENQPSTASDDCASTCTSISVSLKARSLKNQENHADVHTLGQTHMAVVHS